MGKSKIIEICCGSYEDALCAYRGGAKRIELNSALYLGGLTPSLASLQLTKKNTDLKVICMVRPRGAGFCYSPDDFQVMKLDEELLLENGADGIAFGYLNSDSTINIEQTKTLIELTHKYGKEAVFHRAFDCVKDPFVTAEKLIELGADRILTSGQKATAWEGRKVIAQLQKKYGSKIEILAGSGINKENANIIMEETGIFQVHSSCKEWKKDPTTKGNEVTYEYAPSPHENDYEAVSEEIVKGLTSKN